MTFLLTDITGLLPETATHDREEAIQRGRHYSEMLPLEYRPTPEYQRLFHRALAESAHRLAVAVGAVGEVVVAERGGVPVLVSLARAGTPIGVLLRRWYAWRHGANTPHYSISIVRGRGIDEVAMDWILARHQDRRLQFVDGWTGKGAISRELTAACAAYDAAHGTRLDPELAVLADPGHCAERFGTRDDFLVPSACLNATVSGLVSRTVLNRHVIGPGDFHGAVYYRDLASEDVSNAFVDTVAAAFAGAADEAAVTAKELLAGDRTATWAGMAGVVGVQERFGIDDINLVKPGVGEATRVLLRRVPWQVLIRPDRRDDLEHVLLLAGDRGVPVTAYTDMPYSCIGLIKPLRVAAPGPAAR